MGRRRRAVCDAPWTWVRQVHGANVVVATEPGQHAGAVADAVVTATPGVVVAVHTADCAPVFFEGDGAIGVAHAGWRGLVAGVLEATVEAMADLGHRPRSARLGPCIRTRCYEFGRPELEQVAAAYGPSVRGETAWGTPALDLAAGVRAACERLDITVDDTGICTACSPQHWSHRARADTGRQALVAWIGHEPERK
ncbi:MAG: polyphenol oxidase family protein [Aquihabitans sp.]